MKLRRALLPLHIVSKILCISPLSLKSFQPSKFDTALTICQAVGYTIFHLWMVNRDMSTDLSKNLVRQLIDSYNHYSGFCAFCVLVTASIFTQRKIVQVNQNIEDVDQILEKQLNITNKNAAFRRWTNLTKNFSIFSLYHFKIVLRFSFQQKSLSTNMFLHSCNFNSWVAKLFDVYSRFGAVFGILPYYVSGLVLSNSCSKCFIIYCLHWILCFSSNVCNRHHWDPVLRLPYCNPTSPSATEWTFATFWRNSSFQWQWHWQC